MVESYIILGANLDTGNLGVSALLTATVKCIHQEIPTAQILLFDGVRNPVPQVVRLADGVSIELGRVGVRCNKTIWKGNNLFVLLMIALIGYSLPMAWRKKLWKSNSYLRVILDSQAVLDITGGDSFSDIYGLRRMVLGSLRKILVLLLGKDLILLPQTYGPFKTDLARRLARWILGRATEIYARDQKDLVALTQLMGLRTMRNEPKFVPDVAFTLDAIPPKEINILPCPLPANGANIMIGFNVSGLLWHGGYSRNNMFGLNVEYRHLVITIMNRLLEQQNTIILLIPHVFPELGLDVESDSQVCREIFEKLNDQFPGRLYYLDGKYNQSEIKSIIGRCNFFLGSRMHACIAAISQGIPVVGLAYSKKFSGVFECVDVGDCVVDMCQLDYDEIVCASLRIYRNRDQIKNRLQIGIVSVQRPIMTIFEDMRRNKSL